MYCPQCSHAQVSNDARFCSSCGFRLDIVAELLTNDGDLAIPRVEEPISRWERARTRFVGSKFLLLGILMVPVAFLFQGLFNSPLGFFPVVILLFAGMVQQIIHDVAMYARGMSVRPAARDKMFGTTGTRPDLRSARSVDQLRSFETGEMIRPPSVTEHTTKLFPNERSCLLIKTYGKTRDRPGFIN